MPFALNPQDPIDFPGFHSGELINEFEMIVLEIVELCLGDRFRYLVEYPLEKICQRPENAWLDKSDWQFLVSSRVDIAVMDRRFKTDRRAKLVIECQSHWHDNPMAEKRDHKKAKFLASVDVPLIYVRRVEADPRFYRFYTPDGQAEVFYNVITQAERSQLETWLLWQGWGNGQIDYNAGF